jgi:hypothetical protein
LGAPAPRTTSNFDDGPCFHPHNKKPYTYFSFSHHFLPLPLILLPCRSRSRPEHALPLVAAAVVLANSPPTVEKTPKKKLSTAAAQHMSDEAWAHELAQCRFVTEDRKCRRKANKAALTA